VRVGLCSAGPAPEVDTSGVPHIARLASQNTMAVTMDQATGENPTGDIVGILQPEARVDSGPSENAGNPPPAYSAVTNPDQPGAQNLSQPVARPDQPTGQASASLTLQESQVEEPEPQPAPADEPIPTPQTTLADDSQHPVVHLEPGLTRMMIDPEVMTVLRNVVEEQRSLREDMVMLKSVAEEQRSLREVMTETSRDIFQMRVSTEMLKGGQGRLFGKLSEVFDEQFELRHAVEELKEWRRAASTSEREHTEIAVVKEEVITPPIPTPGDGDVRSELSYATDGGGDEEVDLQMGERGQRDLPPHLLPRRSRVEADNEENDRKRTVRRETMTFDGRRTQDLPENFKRLITGHPLARSSDVRLEEHDQPSMPRRSVTLPHEVGFGAPPRDRGDERQQRELSWPGSDDGSDHGSDWNRRPNRDDWGRGHRRRSRSRSSRREKGDRWNRGGSSGDLSPSSSSEDDWDAESEDSYLANRERRHRRQREDHDDPLSKYQRGQLKDIRDKIWKMVGRELTYATSYRGAKDSGSKIEKFSGGNNYEGFMEWLKSILLFFLNNRMCGPDNEMVRITSMVSFLEGKVRRWFSDHVTNSKSRRYWDFENIICGLFNAFVFGSAASQAAKAFQEVRYSRREGVLAFLEELKARARRLV